jgi:type II secretory pathway pseudopilin PulG
MYKNKLQKLNRMDAFTLLEAVIALAVVSIALLGLLRLNLISISLVDRAQATSQAVLLAQQKIEEAQCLGYQKLETQSGIVERNGLTMFWQTRVNDLSLSQFDELYVTGLRKVLVDVAWKNGSSQRQVQLSTYVADKNLQ